MEGHCHALCGGVHLSACHLIWAGLFVREGDDDADDDMMMTVMMVMVMMMMMMMTMMMTMMI